MRRVPALALCLLLAALAAGTARAAENGAWTAYGHDAQLTNWVASSAIRAATAPRLGLTWRRRLDGWIVASPLAAPVGGRRLVFAATEAGSIYALAADTGAVVWRRAFGAVDTGACGPWGFSSTGAIDTRRSRLYAIGADGLLRGLDLATGADAPGFPLRLVERTRTEYVWGGLRVVGDRLYVPVASYCDVPDEQGVGAEGRLLAVGLDDAHATATFDPVPGYGNLGGMWGWGGVSAEPDGSVVYTATGNSYVYSEACACFRDDAGFGDSVVALTPDLGSVLASNRPDSVPPTGDEDFGAAPLLFRPPGCPPLAAANNKWGGLYVWDRTRLEAGPLQTLALGDGKSPFVGAPSYDQARRTIVETQVVTSAGAYGLVALRAGADCRFAPVWRATFGSGSQPPPLLVADVVVAAGGASGGFAAFNAANGRLRWRYETTASTLSPLIAAGGTILGGDAEGTLYAFRVQPKKRR